MQPTQSECSILELKKKHKVKLIYLILATLTVAFKMLKQNCRIVLFNDIVIYALLYCTLVCKISTQ